MRIAKIIFGILSVLVITVASLITLGLYSGDILYYVVAVWLTVLLLSILVIALFRGYERIVNRLGTANQRLAELKFLQERRYEQTRGRLENLLDIAGGAHPNSGNSHQVAGWIPGHSAGPVRHSELVDLNARFQRTERRIVGRLENEFHENNIRNRQIEELVAQLEAAVQDLNRSD